MGALCGLLLAVLRNTRGGPLFGGAPPKPPPPPPPQPMPDLLDPAILAAQKRSTQLALAGGGRAGTVLTNNNDYSTDKLGSR